MARPARIDREAVLAQAAVLLAEGGLAAVTLRALAARLGVQAPSLARHVGDKASLASLLSARIFLEALHDIPSGLRGGEWLHAFGEALWAKQKSTPDIALLLASPYNREAASAPAAAIAAQMEAAGLSGPHAHDAQSAVQALVTGWATFARRPGIAEWESPQAIERRFAASLEALIAGFGYA